MTYVVMRRGHGPLHVATPTGRGYSTVCGHHLDGANVDVPRPHALAGRKQLERHWAKLWALEVACLKCRKVVGH